MLKKDLLELCLLQLLAGGDKYGYEVLTPLRAAFPDTQESAIYALLRGLGKSGLTTWYMAPGAGDRTGSTTSSPPPGRPGWRPWGPTGGTCGTPSRPLGWSDLIRPLRGHLPLKGKA